MCATHSSNIEVAPKWPSSFSKGDSFCCTYHKTGHIFHTHEELSDTCSCHVENTKNFRIVSENMSSVNRGKPFQALCM